MRHEIDPTVDCAFKRLFGSEADTSILIDQLNAVSQTTSGLIVREVTLQNPFSAKEFEDDKHGPPVDGPRRPTQEADPQRVTLIAPARTAR